MEQRPLLVKAALRRLVRAEYRVPTAEFAQVLECRIQAIVKRACQQVSFGKRVRGRNIF
jgi:hypothetical protein